MSAPERSARDAILAAVREARPPAVARVEAPIASPTPAGNGGISRTDAFNAAGIAAGADVTVCARGDVARIVDAALGGARSVLSFSDVTPFAARVVVVVNEEDLVDDLHAAYARIDVRAHPFGAFVAGPSKTADIEQSLVIGAHGPKALSIVVGRA
ncbi:MAG: LUD domain-containing protein [Gemmatimonadetes bacterium]|nr:LUD domain-containing protein [Gemmatimonadota bacterium]